MTSLSCTVDAYASRLLRLRSPQETVIDPSVGPYVTAVIRSSLSGADDANLSPISTNFPLESISEYESLIELIQDHCGMEPEASKEVLQRIALAVRTGIVTESEDSTHSWNMLRSNSHKSFINSYSLGTDADLTVTPDKPLWKDSFISSNDGIKPLGSHVGASFSNEENVRKTSPYSEGNTTFQIDEGIQLNGFDPSYSYSDTDYSLLSNDTSNRIDSASSSFPSSSTINPTYEIQPSFNTDDYIPVDLLGVIGDTNTQLGSPLPTKDTSELSIAKKSPPLNLDERGWKGESLEEYPPVKNEEKSIGLSVHKVKGRKGKNKATDIAALLFKPSRPRSNSVQEVKSPKLQSSTNIMPSVPNLSSLSFSNGYDQYSKYVTAESFSQNIESTAQMLLSINLTLSEEAAYDASVLANADINVAQHVIDSALSAPAVCRHMLNDSCYRSDCQFSHDVDGHTCLFWLKGRCGKGDGCRFLHGFSHTLLDNVNEDYVPEYPQSTVGIEAGNRAYTTSSNKSHQPIQTANLVQHNMKTTLAATTRQGLNRSGSFDFYGDVNSSQSTSSILFHSSMWKSSSNGSSSLSIAYTPNQEENNYNASSCTETSVSNSFASIASKGFSECSFSGDLLKNSNSYTQDKSFVRIPQDLWNANHNRSSSAFQIIDPIARYAEVSRSVIRDDIIDLHFQSLKTFPVVLSQILPEKLRQFKEVWIVSGSGHHVSRNSHQKSGGVLDNAVIEWLDANKYNFTRGKDKNGFGGAVLVTR